MSIMKIEKVQLTKKPKPLFKTNSASVSGQKNSTKCLQTSDNPKKFLGSQFAQKHYVYKSGIHITCKPGYYYRLPRGNTDQWRRVYSIKECEFPKKENVLVVDNKTGKVVGFVRV